VYHSPEDTAEKLDYPKVDATARWLTRFVRTARTRADAVTFDDAGRDDAGTLDEILGVLGALAPASPEAATMHDHVQALRGRCDAAGRLSPSARHEIPALVERIESRLA
jgi:hypothetical protein